mgnify:CR=1 FL=1
MIGLAKTLTGQGTGKKVGKSFKGRPVVEVEASPFDEVKSREFLRTGADLCNVSMQDNEIEDAAKAYRGNPGMAHLLRQLQGFGLQPRQG